MGRLRTAHPRAPVQFSICKLLFGRISPPAVREGTLAVVPFGIRNKELLMPKRHLLLLAGLAVLLALTQGCGSGGGTNNSTVPPKAEFLYVTSSNFSGGLVTSQFNSFKLDTSTGTLT